IARLPAPAVQRRVPSISKRISRMTQNSVRRAHAYSRRAPTRHSRNLTIRGSGPKRLSPPTPPRESAECTMRPAPAHSATCETRPRSAKNSRSPASKPAPSDAITISSPWPNCWSLSRGSVIPRAAYTACTSPEQSMPHSVRPPHKYDARAGRQSAAAIRRQDVGAERARRRPFRPVLGPIGRTGRDVSSVEPGDIRVGRPHPQPVVSSFEHVEHFAVEHFAHAWRRQPRLAEQRRECRGDDCGRRDDAVGEQLYLFTQSGFAR